MNGVYRLLFKKSTDIPRPESCIVNITAEDAWLLSFSPFGIELVTSSAVRLTQIDPESVYFWALPKRLIMMWRNAPMEIVSKIIVHVNVELDLAA